MNLFKINIELSHVVALARMIIKNYKVFVILTIPVVAIISVTALAIGVEKNAMLPLSVIAIISVSGTFMAVIALLFSTLFVRKTLL